MNPCCHRQWAISIIWNLSHFLSLKASELKTYFPIMEKAIKPSARMSMTKVLKHVLEWPPTRFWGWLACTVASLTSMLIPSSFLRGENHQCPLFRDVDGIKYTEVISCLFQNFYPLHATPLRTLFCNIQFEACFRGMVFASHAKYNVGPKKSVTRIHVLVRYLT